MLNRFAPIAFSLLAVTLLTGCDLFNREARPDASGFEGARSVRVADQIHGNDSSLDQPMVQLIRNQADLRRLDAESLNGLNVNFSEHDVVLFTLGEQPTGGYWAHITGVQVVGEVLYVQGVANQPGDDEAVTQAMTYPYAVALIPKTDANIALSDIESVSGQTRPE